mmetsp:Transcript_8517/g.20433  ORF Transcript_8517/g.20433 Transcript_8517/m.20433 type:complete len:90 (+) Transcript_8517:463-732(+)
MQFPCVRKSSKRITKWKYRHDSWGGTACDLRLIVVWKGVALKSSECGAHHQSEAIAHNGIEMWHDKTGDTFHAAFHAGQWQPRAVRKLH